MVGRVLGHYRILEKIGGGGMGVVYRAHDDRLDRDVAIKVLPQGTLHDEATRKRFRTEALALSKLNHPNIATVHDFDTLDATDFLVMELVKGQTLADRVQQGAMPEQDVLAIGIQIGQALEEAHEHGVIHRDLKPGNIMLTAKNQVKVLDFGLAKCYQLSSDVDLTQSLTQDRVAGTLPYMAPEQLQGLRVDQRCDVYALGTVLYETATGQRPFDEKLSTALADSILHKTPPVPGRLNPKISSKLEEIILKCLEKSPDNRYQSAKELEVDLRRLKRDSESGQAPTFKESSTSPGSARKRSIERYAILGICALALLVAVGIWRMSRPRLGSRSPRHQTAVAVLPFQNMGSDKSRDFLRFAVPDEVVNALSYVPALAIRPFAATRKYAEEAIDVQAIGRDLRVANIITGHYLLDGDRLQVTVEAIDVESNSLIWQQTVNGLATDTIPLQEQIISRVRHGMLPALGASASSAPNGSQPKNNEAYDLYQRSLGITRDTGPNREGISLLERAVRLDPTYAPAWTALGRRYYSEGMYSGGGQAVFSRSTEAFQRAVALDPDLVEPAAQLIKRHVEQGRLETAFDEADTMVKRRPDSVAAHIALAYVLRYGGLLEDAVRECDTASELDSGDESIKSCTTTFLVSGKYERAVNILRMDIESEHSRMMMTEILLRQGKPTEALRVLPDDTNFGLPMLKACIGKEPLAKIAALAKHYDGLIMELPDSDPKYFQGGWDAYCGLRENALRLLRTAVEQGNCLYPAMDIDPMYGSVRQTPEYRAIRQTAIECRQRFVEHRSQRHP